MQIIIDKKKSRLISSNTHTIRVKYDMQCLSLELIENKCGKWCESEKKCKRFFCYFYHQNHARLRFHPVCVSCYVCIYAIIMQTLTRTHKQSCYHIIMCVFRDMRTSLPYNSLWSLMIWILFRFSSGKNPIFLSRSQKLLFPLCVSAKSFLLQQFFSEYFGMGKSLSFLFFLPCFYSQNKGCSFQFPLNFTFSFNIRIFLCEPFIIFYNNKDIQQH
jgi:hypothetical protein